MFVVVVVVVVVVIVVVVFFFSFFFFFFSSGFVGARCLFCFCLFLCHQSILPSGKRPISVYFERFDAFVSSTLTFPPQTLRRAVTA